jgi:ribose 5-phosphate isomerase B
MRIAIAADHGGFALKEALRHELQRKGHEVRDYGTSSLESVDYPDYAALVAKDVVSGGAERGILVCTTGVGMSIAANKIDGIRAALAVSPDEVRLTRAHNDANVLTLGAKYVDQAHAGELVDVFLSTEFDGGRHATRVAKIAALEHDEAASK